MTDQNKMFTVARRILATDPSCDKMKLHKLLYYVQGWSQAWTGRPLFQDAPEAWTYGPVYPKVYAAQNSNEPGGCDDRCRRERLQDEYPVESRTTNPPGGAMARGTRWDSQ